MATSLMVNPPCLVKPAAELPRTSSPSRSSCQNRWERSYSILQRTKRFPCQWSQEQIFMRITKSHGLAEGRSALLKTKCNIWSAPGQKCLNLDCKQNANRPSRNRSEQFRARRHPLDGNSAGRAGREACRASARWTHSTQLQGASCDACHCSRKEREAQPALTHAASN